MMTLRGSLVGLVATALLLSTPARAETEKHGFVLLRAAGTYRRLGDIPIYGAEFEAGAGSRDASLGQSVSVQVLLGRTGAALVTRGVDFAYRQEWYVGTRAWLGFSGELGGLWLERVTKDGTLGSFGVGGALRAGYDAILDNRVRAGPELAFDATAYGPIAWGPTLGLRIQLIEPPRPRRRRALPQPGDVPSDGS